MIKKRQKWIALLVTLSFLGLLQVSAMPVNAAGANEQVAAAGAEQGPRVIEEEGSSGFVGKKKSILPVVLIGVGVVALAAVLFLVVLKPNYDIRGNWSETDTIWTEGATTIIFSGEKTAGTLRLVDFNDTGIYTVDGKKVHFEFGVASQPYKWVFDGEFDGKDKMKGTVEYKVNGAVNDTGTWEATRVSEAAYSSNRPLAKSPDRKVQ